MKKTKQIAPILGKARRRGDLTYDHLLPNRPLRELSVYQTDGTTYIALAFDDKSEIRLELDTRPLATVSVWKKDDRKGDMDEIARSKGVPVPSS